MAGTALSTVLVACLLGCSTDERQELPASADSTSIRTLSPLPAPSVQPSSGRLTAELRQSSRDVALGRMQVWLGNDTHRDLTPSRVTYRDGRFPTPLNGDRLRPVPAGAERGYPLVLPRRPRCGGDAPGQPAELVVEHASGRETVRVADPTDVAGRYRGSRCLEIAVSEVARLRWSDEVPTTSTGREDGRLTLEVTPTGRGAGRLRILTVGGTPLLGPAGSSYWRVGVTVRATGRPLRLPLEVRPVRCDAHAFAEAAGATTFRVSVAIDRRRGSLLLPMSRAGASEALAYAADACDLD